MNERRRRPPVLFALAALLWVGVGSAQAQHQHSAPADTTVRRRARPAPRAHAAMRHDGTGMRGMVAAMTGMYGPYSMTREASGTSWQPDAGRHEGIHVTRGKWMAMVHGFADLVYDHQGGDRGDTRVFSSNMGMTMAHRRIGPGRLGLRSMLSLEPGTIGRRGYPLLLQSGETGDGRTPLIDRQHPHDLFMELAGSYSVSSGNRSIFLYAGVPGEPALGPPAFMHRHSGMSIPVAPITHHWLDSSHITFGVITAGAVVDRVKVEASAFRGREPDEERWNIESPKLDSHSLRLSVNPTEHWALQMSYGRIHSPEQLEPEVDQDRTTASAMYEGALGGAGRWQGTLAWGRNRNRPGRVLDALSAEAAASIGEHHTLFARAERVEKDELFVEPDSRAGEAFDVGELTAGYRYDFRRHAKLALGIGAAGTLSQVPRELRDSYGDSPASAVVFLHAALQ